MMKRGHDVESAPSIWRRRTAMEHYAGIDVSLELSSVCVVDAQDKIVKEAKVASEPEAVVAFFEALGFAVKRIGLEAGPLSQWLHAGLKEAGFETVLLETRHVKAALSAMTVKTDRKDARGLATAAADGMVPAGARQIDGIAGSAGTAGRAQAALGTAYRCGIKHPGNTARFWPEGWCGDAQGVRGADSGIGDGPGHIGAYRRGDAIDAGCIEGGIRKATPSCTCDRS